MGKKMIVDQENFKLLTSNSLFKGLTEESVKPYLKSKNFLKTKEGEILYVPDDKATNIYLIVEGEVKVKISETRKVEYKYISDFFGEAEILQKTNRLSSAVSNTECVLYKISVDELEYLSKTYKTVNENLNKLEATGESEEIENEESPGLEEINEPVSDMSFESGELESNENNESREGEAFTELSDNELESLMARQKEKKHFEEEMNQAEAESRKNDLSEDSDIMES